MTKGETISPTIMQESLMVTCIIDEIEGREVAIADITNTFLQTDMVHSNLTVRVRLFGVFADLLARIDPSKFADKVVLEGGHKVIYAVDRLLFMTEITTLSSEIYEIISILHWNHINTHPYINPCFHVISLTVIYILHMIR